MAAQAGSGLPREGARRASPVALAALDNPTPTAAEISDEAIANMMFDTWEKAKEWKKVLEEREGIRLHWTPKNKHANGNLKHAEIICCKNKKQSLQRKRPGPRFACPFKVHLYYVKGKDRIIVGKSLCLDHKHKEVNIVTPEQAVDASASRARSLDALMPKERHGTDASSSDDANRDYNTRHIYEETVRLSRDVAGVAAQVILDGQHEIFERLKVDLYRLLDDVKKRVREAQKNAPPVRDEPQLPTVQQDTVAARNGIETELAPPASKRART